MTKKGMDRMQSGTVCTAKRRNGEPCLNYAVQGAKVCRMHGGSAPQVRAAAQVRILMASDLAAKKLVDLMQSPTVDDRVKLSAAKDLLDRANLAGTQNVEIGVTKRDFSDVTADVVLDLDMGEDDDPNTVERSCHGGLLFPGRCGAGVTRNPLVSEGFRVDRWLPAG